MPRPGHTRYCFLLRLSRQKQAVKRALVLLPGVRRVTDHGGHLKINASRWVAWDHAVLVKDRTEHFDVRYWDFAMAAFRHSVRHQHGEKGLRVMLHYLCNLYGVREASYLGRVARGRRQLKMTARQAHGWELDALR